MANKIGKSFIDDEEGNNNSFFLKQPPRILGLNGERLTPLEPDSNGNLDTHSMLLGGVNKKFENFIDSYNKDIIERNKVQIVIRKELSTIRATVDDIYDLLEEQYKFDIKHRKLRTKLDKLQYETLNSQLREFKRSRSASGNAKNRNIFKSKLGRSIGKAGSTALGTAVGGLFDTLLPGLASAGLGGFLATTLLLGGKGLWGLTKLGAKGLWKGGKGLWGLGTKGFKGFSNKFARTGATRVASGNVSRMATSGAIDMVKGSDGVWRMAGSQATRRAGTQLAVRGAGSTALRTAGTQVAVRGGAGAVAGTVGGGAAVASAGALLAILATIPVVKWGVNAWDKWTKEQKYGNELTEQVIEELKKPKWYDHLLDFLSALPFFNGIGLNKYDLPRLSEELDKNQTKEKEQEEKTQQAVNSAMQKSVETFENLGKKTDELATKFENVLPNNKFGNFLRSGIIGSRKLANKISTGTTTALAEADKSMQKSLQGEQHKLYLDWLKKDTDLQALDKYSKDLKSKYRITSGVEMNRTVKLPDGSYQTRNHYGIDYGLKSGTPLYLPVNANITDKRYQGKTSSGAGAGHYYKAVTEQGYTITGMHMSQATKLAQGSNYQAGTLIGYSGNSGGVDPHYHLQIEKVINGTHYIIDTDNQLVMIKGHGTKTAKTLEKMQKAAQDELKKGFEEATSWTNDLLGIFDHLGEMLSPITDEIQKSFTHGKKNSDIKLATTWDVGNQYKNTETDLIRKHYMQEQAKQDILSKKRNVYPLNTRDGWEQNSLPVQGASYGGIDISTGLFEKMALFVQQ